MKKIISSSEIKLVLFCIFFRIVLFGFYGYKVSECPDSWAFNNLAEKIGEQVSITFTAIFNQNNEVNNSSAIVTSQENNSKGQTSIGERSPGYPLLLYFCTSKFATVIFQFILGIVTAILWFRTLLKLNFSSKFSFFAVIILQTYLQLFIYETFILVETSVLFIISLIFYLISDGYLTKKISLKSEILIAVLFGYLVLIKPFYVILPFILLGIRFINNPNLRTIFDKKLLIVFVSLISYFGWSLIVEKYTGYFVSTSYFGLNKSQNCVYFAEKGLPEYQWIIDPYVKHRDIAIKENKEVAMSIWFALNNGEFKDKNLTFPELSNELGNYAESTIKNNFADYFHQVITKSWFDFWKSFDVKDGQKFDNQTAEKVLNIIYLIQNKLIMVFKFLFLPISLLVFYNYLRNKKLNFSLITCVVIWSVSLVQAMVTYGENARFSFPFEYLMILIVVLFIRNTIKLPRFLSNYLQ